MMLRHFDQELENLIERLILMGRTVEEMIRESVRALVERDETILEEVFRREAEVDRLLVEIDETCLSMLALHQPMATDLRFIASAIKINADLERMGDQAVNIAQRAKELVNQPPVKPLIDIPRMAELAQQMLRDSLEAFTEGDEGLALKVILADDQVDNLRDQVFRELLTYMISDPITIPRAIQLILVSRHLERIADHATNIAEDVIYIVRGQDVRKPTPYT